MTMMATKTRRRLLLTGSFCVALGAALTGCGGGGSDEPTAEKASVQAVVAPAKAQPARHRALAYQRAGVTSIVASADGKLVAVAHSDGRVRLLEAGNRTEVHQLAEAGSSVAAGLIFSDDARYVVAVDRDSTARVWSADTGALRLTMHGHESPLRSIGASADGTVVATGGEETRVLVWDGSTGRLKRVLTGGTDYVNAIGVSPDGQWIASGDAAARILVWNTASGKLLGTLRGHANEVTATVFSPDGKTLASAGEDGKVILWDTPSGATSSILQNSGSPIHSLAFSRDGRLLAVGSSDGQVRVWDLSTHAKVQETSNAGAAVNALAFGANDKNELLFGDGHSSVLSMNVSAR